MNILVIGASGLVGGNCWKYFNTQKDVHVVGTHVSYATKQTAYFNVVDLSDSKNFDVTAFRPNVIVHCGALTNVDHCETHEQESYLKTVITGKNVIRLCQQHRAQMVYLSTDYVFDGRRGPYDEAATVNPLSVYARHKLEIESTILQELPTSLIMRIANVYGEEERNKNFIARILQNIRTGASIHLRLPYDQYATPVNAYDVARAMFKLISDKKEGIYHIASTDFMNRVQLARKVLSYFPEIKATIEPVSTVDLKQAAARPLLGGLVSAKFLAAYPDFCFSNVDDFLKKVKRPI